MAIASFLVLVENGRLEEARAVLAAMEGLTVQDAGDAHHLVVVAQSPSGHLPGLEQSMKAVDGVLALSTAYLNIEDELEEAGTARAPL